jgi:antitoxin component of MazEF toxin-antitoxin module
MKLKMKKEREKDFFKTSIKKFGGSYGIHIPMHIIKTLNLCDRQVNIYVQKQNIKIIIDKP